MLWTAIDGRGLDVQRPPGMPHTWNVEIDAAGDLRAEPVEAGAVASLMDRLSDNNASVSHLPRRYTTRLAVYATDPLEAAAEALDLWRTASEGAGLPAWPVTRLEVTRTGE